MKDVLNFLFEGSLILALLFGIYWAFLRQLTFFGWNRIYLLLSMLLSLSIPLMSFKFIDQSFGISGEMLTYYLPEFILGSQNIQFQSIGIFNILFAAYAIGFIIGLIRFVKSLIKVFIQIRGASIYTIDNQKILVNHEFDPSSFFGLILLPEYQEENKDQQLIILHESGHVKRMHSLDLIFLQIFKTVFWFHPINSMLEASLREIHEFQVDRSVIRQYSPREYAMLLLNLLYKGRSENLLNTFNQFQTKKRIMMMKKADSYPIQKARFLIAVPVIALTLFVFACEKPAENDFPKTTDIPISDETTGSIPEQSETNMRTETVFDLVEEAPEFQDGIPGLTEFLVKNLKYPEQARSLGIEGTVFVAFVIDANGSVRDVEVLKGIGAGCDKEAKRVVELFPDWIPGKQKGQPVNTRMKLPIKFALS
ncbi:TonB family protein [Aquiflexum sp.]|uniref:M56 family metallopeptidase n=1 Tax=Aquiflexum sp. TaxID=1872584 RepID=UPI0035948C72